MADEEKVEGEETSEEETVQLVHDISICQALDTLEDSEEVLFVHVIHNLTSKLLTRKTQRLQ